MGLLVKIAEVGDVVRHTCRGDNVSLKVHVQKITKIVDDVNVNWTDENSVILTWESPSLW
jgi:hypothetical protein